MTLDEQVAKKLGTEVKPYSTKIQAAWELWDHFHEMATLTKHEGKWILDYGRRYKIEADTAPRAIALCFLKLP